MQWQDRWQIALQLRQMFCFVVKFSHSKTPTTHTYKLGNNTLPETDSHTYLGVQLSKDLRWSNHIDHITSMAKTVLCMVHRNLHSCPKDLKSTAYTTLVRPHLEYLSMVWDPYTKKHIQSLNQFNDRPLVLHAEINDPRSSVTEMLERLEREPLQSRRTASPLTCSKIQTGQVAISAQKFLQLVSRSTRHNNSKAYQWYQTKTDCFL